MKTKSDNSLFFLIKSLTPDEKRYFRTYAAGQTRNNLKVAYLRIFDLIEKQTEYNEVKIIVKLKTISPAYFSKLKNYLTEQILKHLEIFHRTSSPENELRSLLNRLKILYEKGEFSTTASIIERAKSLSRENELFGLLLEVLNYEGLLYDKQGYSTITAEQLKQYNHEKQEAVSAMLNVNEYLNVKRELSFLQKKYGRPRNKSIQKQYDLLMKNPLLLDEKKAITVSSKIIFNEIHSAYYAITLNDDKTITYIQRNNFLLESNEKFIRNNPSVYMYNLYSESVYFATMLEGKLVELLSEKIKNVVLDYDITSEELLSRSFVYSTTPLLGVYIDLGEFKKIHLLINEIKLNIKRYEGKINNSPLVIIYYTVAQMYFGAKEYKTSLKWFNKIINRKDDSMPNFVAFSKIMQLIIFYELRDFDLLPYAIRSVYRFLYKNKRVYKFENILFEFIRKTKRNLEPRSLEPLKQLKKEFVMLEDDDFEKYPFVFFDFVSWLDSKIKNTSFEEIIRKKSKAKKAALANKHNA